MSELSLQHIVQQPKFLFFIKIAQAVLAFITLALSSFAISVLPNTFGTFGFNIFCSLYTFIVCAYLISTPIWLPALWNCWAALVLEIFGVIFWLCGFATLAAWAALGTYTTNYLTNYDAVYNYTKRSSIYNSDKELKTWDRAWQCAAAAAGLGALIWVLYMVTLITFSIFLHRHRKNPENANLPDDGSPAVESHVVDVEGKAGHGIEMNPVQQY